MRSHRDGTMARVLAAALVIAAALVVAAVPPAVGGPPAGYWPTKQWPAGWQNPLGDGARFEMTTKWGAFSTGCPNYDRTNPGTVYLEGPTTAHTGLDMNGAEGQAVKAVADGVVRNNGQLWGRSSHHVVFIEHTTSDGETFVGIYGHLGDDVVRTGPIRKGEQVGRITAAGTGPHLHFGVAPGPWTGEAPPGATESEVGPSGRCTVRPGGTVDPLVFLADHAPGGAPTGTSTPTPSATPVTEAVAEAGAAPTSSSDEDSAPWWPVASGAALLAALAGAALVRRRSHR